MTNVNSLGKFLRPDIVAMKGFVSRSPQKYTEDIIKLNSNENPYGCSPRVQKALASYPYLNRYPDSYQRELRSLLSEYTGVGPEYILASNGGDELIDQVLRSFIEPGDEVVDCVPSFGVFRIRTHICGGNIVEVPRDEDFAVNVKAVKAAITKKTKMIVLVSPGNPTGTLMPQRDILEVVGTGLPVLVDEAYAEFSGETVTQLVGQYENMMVIRTLSKWAGLAGMRIGYGIFQPEVINNLMKVKLSFNVNAAVVIAVRESIKDLEYLQGNVRKIIAERERLFAELSKLKFIKPHPSWANFIYCSVLDGDAITIRDKLENKGIWVGSYDIGQGRTGLRISVGKPEHTDALLKALWEIGEEIGG